MEQRLQKLISAAGLASRRAAEELITAGRVAVNGQTAALGMSADPDTDEITLDGKPVLAGGERVYIMLNKPTGYVTTLSDEKGRRTVAELVKDAGTRLYPVGRLDIMSEGLLLMTNDGAVAAGLTHPSHGIEKVYELRVSGGDPEAAVRLFESGMELDGERLRPARCEILDSRSGQTLMTVAIHEGKNRQIRRMCEQAGMKVQSLCRVAEGELRLGSLARGKWRFLDSKETQYLREITKK